MALIGAAVGVPAAAAALLYRFAADRRGFLVWCSDFILARVTRGDAAAGAAYAAAAILAAAATVSAAAFIAREGLQSARLRSHARDSVSSGRALAAAAAVGVPDAVSVIRGDASAAFTMGLWRPRIVLTDRFVSELTLEELKAVIAHEAYHLRRRDPLRSFLWELLRRSFFFLPALKDLTGHFALRREIAADEAAAAESGGRRALASALLKALSGQDAYAASAAPFGHLSPRIRVLAGRSSPKDIEVHVGRMLSTLAVVGIIAASQAALAGPALARDGTGPPICRGGSPEHMSRLNFSPYLRIDVAKPQMSPAVQSTRIGP